ncbi:TetR family transcriptional regulator [Pseudomonas sp. MC042]|uniref:TetR family transcriptional regulator n=2 Tax=Pseudomonas piscis TaxID=2614538 RepID=A0A7X1PPE6_9PSED|nr:TetR family transcriptional regulator [Pseudomonas piscis]
MSRGEPFMKSSSTVPKVSGHKHGRVPRAIRELQILDIAEQQFIDLGYESTTVESVRLAAGVSRPIIYDHYGSKDKLYLACVKRARQQYEEKLIDLANLQLSPVESLARGADLYLSIIEENPKRWQALFGGSLVPMSGKLGDELSNVRHGTVELLAQLIQAQAPDTDPERVEAFALAVFAVGENMGRWWLRHPEIPRSRVLSHNLAFISNGLSQLANDELPSIQD